MKTEKITLKKIGLEAQTLVQEILDDIPTYMLNAEGVRKRPDAAKYELTLLPPNCRPEQKINLLVYQGAVAIGFADLLRDFPDLGTGNLGLLAIRESYQKRSLGRLAYQAVEEYALKRMECKKIRLAVNDTNPVQGFWEKMGFIPTGERKPYQGVARESTIIVMEKQLKL